MPISIRTTKINTKDECGNIRLFHFVYTSVKNQVTMSKQLGVSKSEKRYSEK